MKSNDLHWLAGFLEGEGSFLAPPPSAPNSPIISAQSTDEDIIIRVADLFGVTYCSLKRRQSNWKPVFAVRCRSYPAVKLMGKLRSLLGSRRQHQIGKALSTYKDRRQSPARHGTYSKYSMGCRCSPCHEAMLIYMRQYRLNKRAA